MFSIRDRAGLENFPSNLSVLKTENCWEMSVEYLQIQYDVSVFEKR